MLKPLMEKIYLYLFILYNKVSEFNFVNALAL